jgi:hypothetical protein
MKYYDIPDEATWNSVVGSLGEIRIREIVVDLRYHEHCVTGDTASNPDERIIFCIRDDGIFANLLKATLKSSEEVSK